MGAKEKKAPHLSLYPGGSDSLVRLMSGVKRCRLLQAPFQPPAMLFNLFLAWAMLLPAFLCQTGTCPGQLLVLMDRSWHLKPALPMRHVETRDVEKVATFLWRKRTRGDGLENDLMVVY